MRSLVLAALLIPSLAAASPDHLIRSSDEPGWGEPVHPPGPTPRLEREPPADHLVALAVNEPFGWAAGTLAASAYVALGRHVALRVNLARYAYRASPMVDLIAAMMDGDGDEAYRSGGFFDTGVGVTWFPRKLWSGPTLELGMNIRQEKTHIDDEFADPYSVDRDVTTYAARGLAGWSWLMGERWFIAFALGAAYGTQSGSETTIENDYDTAAMSVTRPVQRRAWSAESYLRFGVTL